MLRRVTRVVLAAAAAVTLTFLLTGSPPAATAAGPYVPVNGAGSTWSENAIRQWASNVQQYGMRIDYAGTGSTDGRNQFASGLVDFGVSEIPYGKDDNAAAEAKPKFKYAYMPIVAGGTAFMYNLSIGKNRVTNLRLSGDTLVKIFTNVITKWNDPAIKADNPGLALPARKIVPVVRSDGSGTTAQFSTWMANQYPSLWNAYCARAGRKTPCGVTSIYPTIAGTATTAQSSSTGVAAYVAQDASVGAITYVEYSYALNLHFPVAKIRNKADYYIEPTAPSVAVALLKAKINNVQGSQDYLTQDLRGVYTNADKRTYPLSSYSYMLIPVDEENDRFKVAKGKTLGDFAYYFLCEGQQQADSLGYSPLPKNLVEAGIAQVKRIPGVDVKAINLSGCHNPTFSSDGSNTLAKNAPQPRACDKVGPVQCTTGTGGAKSETPTSNGGNKNNNNTNHSSGGTGNSANPASTAGTGTPTAGSTAGAVIDPDTGQVVGGTGGGGADSVSAIPVSLSNQLDPTLKLVLIIVACALLLGLTVGPPLIARLLHGGGRR
ncbi:phosphate ABC transporter substrate-binding protein PstS [Paractinoplanes globisporus]|uniref:Phosphate ABC transporter substrate-binding protein PstS n=1 Tax=Paractinoplanes globisporus TaxID=113565 RepID=A0ABW6WS48_9ACTN|nr:phosphate ABC transporter substrate-binding protein PstS [Actinoplanes globisporus]